QLAHTNSIDLRRGNAQRHLVLLKVDDEKLQLEPRHLLLLNGDDLANAVRRIDDILVRLVALTLGSLLVYGGHTLQHSSYRPASTSRSERPRLLSGPPRHVASAIRRQGNPLTPHRPRR